MTSDGEAEAGADTARGRSAGLGIPPILEGAEPAGGMSGAKHSFAPTAFLLLVVAGAWIASVVASVAALTAWMVLTGARPSDVKGWMADHSGTVAGILVLVLPGQATFFAASWLAALRSKEGAVARLGLVRGRPTSAAAVLLAVLGTVGVQWIASVGVDLAFGEPSEQMREMWRMLSTPTGVPALAMGLVIAFVPGLCEELLFRGLLLRGLLRHRSALVSIAIAGVLFALAHGEVQYALAVLPLGLWLGFVAWRTGSIRLAIACHAANNLSAFVFGRMLGDPESGDLPSTPWMIAVGIGLCACAVAAAWALPRAPATR
jgi:membrane protease YdiL (CAAX protease family)